MLTTSPIVDIYFIRGVCEPHITHMKRVQQMTKTQQEETPSQRFERQIREGCGQVIEAATHPINLDQVDPLSPERLISIDEWDRRLLGVCADALATCRTQEVTPVEDLIDTLLTAYSHGEIGSDWDEITMQLNRIGDQIAGARLMLRQFPAEVLAVTNASGKEQTEC